MHVESSRSLTVVPHVCRARTLEPETETERLGEAIAELASRIHAATYELLVMLRRFDAAAAWNTGFLTCAHWLHWRTGIDMGAAREKVRVARALEALPLVSAAMRRGELSYAKVRAITRIATPDTEPRLLDVARCGTAAQVERLVRAWRRVDRVAEAAETARRHQRRALHTWVDDDGMVIIRGRLTPEVGAVVQQALAAAGDRLFKESAYAPTPADVTEETTSAQRRADALGLLAESALAADLNPGTAGDRYQVVLHVDGIALQTEGIESAGQAVLEDGGIRVSSETSQRLACDAAVVVMRHTADGSVLDVGRKTRTIPPAIRRALAARDRQCRFPGCTARRCDAHHLEHWADGGATRLDNLVLLCRRHHRLVHEEGWAVAAVADGTLAFTRPRRVADAARSTTTTAGGANEVCLRPVPVVPTWDADEPPLAAMSARLAAEGVLIGRGTAPVWDGTPLHLGWAIDVLHPRASRPT